MSWLWHRPATGSSCIRRCAAGRRDVVAIGGRMLDARLGVRGGQAGLLKYACAISDDRFRIQEQKSAVATTTVARDPDRPCVAAAAGMLKRPCNLIRR